LLNGFAGRCLAALAFDPGTHGDRFLAEFFAAERRETFRPAGGFVK